MIDIKSRHPGQAITLAAADSGSLEHPVLESLPGAPHTLYLCFTGAPDTPPFFFSHAAYVLATIREMWARVSEKFSPFNVNVTTIPKPGCHTMAIGGARMGVAIPGWSLVNNWPGISYVFSDAIFSNRSDDPKVAADCAAHEAGHAAGLEHQMDGPTIHNGDCQARGWPCTWAPLMGNPINTKKCGWTTGTNELGQAQNDVAVLMARFGPRPSAIGQTHATASLLSIRGGTFSGGIFAVSGVIRYLADANCFSFAGQGKFHAELSMAPHGPTFNPRMELRDAGNNTIARGAWWEEEGRDGEPFALDTVLEPADYVLVIASAAATQGDIGQYSLTGSIEHVPVLPKTPGQILHDILNIHFTGNFHQNWLGRYEKWMMGNNGWLFITPDGQLLAWPDIQPMASLSPAHYYRPRMLFYAPWDLTYAFGLHVPPSGHFHNSLGGNEDWWLGDKNMHGNPWYFSTPDKRLFAWDGIEVTPLSGTFLDSIP